MTYDLNRQIIRQFRELFCYYGAPKVSMFVWWVWPLRQNTHFYVVWVKGDWKYLKQAFNLVRHYGSTLAFRMHMLVLMFSTNTFCSRY